jgi:CHAT domain-containing protein/Tfp pilus assembly protein PilF
MKKIFFTAILILFVVKINAQINVDSTSIYFYQNKFDKALKFAKLHNDYNQLIEKGIVLFDNNDFKNTIYYLSCAVDLGKKSLDEIEKISLLNVIGICYEQINDFGKAIEYYEKSIRLNTNNSDEYFKSLNALVSLQCQTEDLFIGEKQSKLFLNEAKKYKGESSNQYLLALNNICLFYLSNGIYDLADKYCLEFIEVNKNIFGIESLETIKANSLYVNSLVRQGKLIEAEKKSLLILDNYNQNFKDNFKDIALDYSQLATIQQELFKYDLARNNFLEALNIIKENYGETNLYYALVASNLGVLFIDLEKYDEAEFYLKKALEIKNTLNGTFDNSNLYSNLATVYQKLNRCIEAEKYNLKSIENLNNQVGESYRTKILNIALTYNCLNNTQKEYKYLLTFSNLLKSKLFEITSYMTNYEREQYLQMYIHQRIYQLSFLNRNPINFNLINTSCFEEELLLKSFSIHNQVRISNSINKSNNSELQIKYGKYVTNKKQISIFNEFPKDQRPLSYNNLIFETENLEKELVLESAEFSKGKNALSIKMKQLQDKLKPNEVIIDFIDFLYYDSKMKPDNIAYGVFIVKKDFKVPQFIPMFEQKQLNFFLSKDKIEEDKIRINKQYIDKSISDLFLMPLKEELKGINTVYLSLSGLAHQFDFAALPINDTQTFGEKYKLHILSSPAELMDYKDSILDKKSKIELLLYGGIDYNKSIGNANLNVDDNSISFNEDFINLAKRNGFKKLPGTLKEVDGINTNACKSGFNSKIFKESEATEESVKALDGKTTPYVLHIATHGYFFSDPVEEISKNILSSGGKSKIYKASDDPMIRSGLLLAGSKNYWGKSNQNNTIEDGILSASEISNLDLSGCQLVVLSACETGLGEVKGSEGVFGLQRAFKMAGVKNIIMSLWKVPDTQTAELFDIFYSECFAGKTIHEAFQSAQAKMKAKYSPYYWAGFVLLE